MRNLYYLGAAVVAAIVLMVGCEVMVEEPVPKPSRPVTPAEPEPEPRRPTGPTGQLRLTSEPSGATVLVTVPNRSGRAVAVAPITTPATLDLSPGEHSITVSKDGASVTGTAVIEKDVDAMAHVTLDATGDTFPRTAYYRFFYHSFIEGHPFYAHETGCAMGWQAGTARLAATRRTLCRSRACLPAWCSTTRR